jgi:hypothetical protein
LSAKICAQCSWEQQRRESINRRILVINRRIIVMNRRIIVSVLPCICATSKAAAFVAEC